MTHLCHGTTNYGDQKLSRYLSEQRGFRNKVEVTGLKLITGVLLSENHSNFLPNHSNTCSQTAPSQLERERDLKASLVQLSRPFERASNELKHVIRYFHIYSGTSITADSCDLPSAKFLVLVCKFLVFVWTLIGTRLVGDFR